ncbi:uncharacterized protein LOC132637002 isoform X2 [Lycium barbarum]|uniref:uncharacterized protein LOC132637002 isoform X2 n=1 Tax=Lycium barbarum TaxID=112863 RepID=UPI00293E7063|nr:uncharacterized protein LOC132637002 isoform X2 [Lycium barbarum]
MWAFWGLLLCLGQEFIHKEKQEKQEPSHHLSLFSFFLYYYNYSFILLYYYCFFSLLCPLFLFFFSNFFVSLYSPRSNLFWLRDKFVICMSKKMKRVALESSSYGVFEEPKARKHQILLQDYQELQKETDSIRHKLEDSKLRKLRLLAEVRFLRQRHKHLLQSKSLSPQKGQELVSLPNIETYPKSRSRDQVITSKKEAKLNKLPPLPGLKQNGRIQVAKVAAYKKTPDIHVNQKQKFGGGVELDRKSRVYNGKEVPSRKGPPAYDMMKQNERLYIASNAISRSSLPAFDLNQENGHSGKEAALPTRAPVFDLNEISTF